MQGGGSGEFSATAYNFAGAWVARKHKAMVDAAGGDAADPKLIQQLKDTVDKHLKMDYLVTGGWSQKAAAEAVRLFGAEHVNIAVDSRESNGGKFGTIPDESTWKLSEDAAMVYYCANETVDGVEFPELPKSLAPGPDGKGPIVVADMSSNILTKKIPVGNFSAIFFGAQKNLGVTGVTVVILNKSFLPPVTAQPSAALMRQLGLPIPPIVFQYETIAKNNSLYNTLSIFEYVFGRFRSDLLLIVVYSVYVAGRVLKKLLQTYPDKVQGQQAVSEKKAQLIYIALEAFPDIYKVIPNKAVRSRVNICFRVTKGDNVDAAEKAFLEQGVAQGLTGLKGHRSLGGIRASNYNSVPLEGAEKLAKFITAFATS